MFKYCSQQRLQLQLGDTITIHKDYERTHVIACSSVCIPETEADYQEPVSFCKATVNSMVVCRKTDILTRVRSIAQSNEDTRSAQVRAT